MDQIELSRNGVKISYLRLISDSATGFIVVLALIYFYQILHIEQNPFGIQPEIKALIPLNISLEIRVFVLFLLFLLSTPLGLIISATSWFCLGWLEVILVQTCAEGNTWLKYFTNSTTEIYRFNHISTYFGFLNKDNFYQTAIYFETLLHVYHPDYIKSIEYAVGCSRLLRSLAFVDICLFFFLRL